MVAYNFQKQFVPAIESGEKTHTIRKNAKRPHAKAGSKLQLYYGMRTKVCRKIRDAVCVFAVPITIDVLESTIAEIRVGSELIDDLEAFAKSDGFESLNAMHQFWLEFHGAGLFEGTFIEWENESLGMMQGSQDCEPQEVKKYVKIIRPDREVTVAELADKTLYLEFVSRATHDGKEVKHVLRLNPESWALMNQAMVVSMEYLELDSLSAILDSHVADGLSQFVCVGGNDALFKRMA